MNHSEAHDSYALEQPGALSVSHLVHTLRKYAAMIAITMIAVMIGYAIVALLIFLRAPSRRITSLPFRLQFPGASAGRYPNGLIFSAADITDTAVLLSVYRANHLEHFMPFELFSNSVFVTESNHDYQMLALEYEGRLADPKLSPIDRERIEREYQHKRDSLSRADFTIAITHTSTADVPPQVAQKVLSDILAAWAKRAIYDRRILQYPINVMSTKVLDRSMMERNDYVIALAMLRNRVSDVLQNIDTLLNEIPGVALVRTHDQLSLGELKVQLEDLLRFQIDPLITTARSSGMVKNPAFDLRVLEAQVAFNQRRLDAARSREAAIRSAFAAYEQSATTGTSTISTTTTNATQPQTQPTYRSQDAVTTQVSDSFIDRIVELAGRQVDRDYRQGMVGKIQAAALEVVPAEEAVAYSTQLLNDFKSGPAIATTPDAAQMLRQGSDEAFAQLDGTINRVYEIYTTAAKLTNPTTQIYTEAGAPV